MRNIALFFAILALCSTAGAGTMVIDGLPERVNTSAGPVHLIFDIVSNGQLNNDEIFVWTYTGGTLDMAIATNRVIPSQIYDDDPLNHDLLGLFVETTNVAHPVIYADIFTSPMPGMEEVIRGDIIRDLGLTIAQGFEGTLEVKVLSVVSGLVEDVATIEAYAGCSPETITVNPDGTADFTTIQEAIIDANDCDTIIVADGTYTGDGNRDIDLHGKAITVISQNGPQTCIIDCDGTQADPHRGFYFHTGEDPNSVINGFTIKNGYRYGSGAGIYCTTASPTIVACIITNSRYGTGIYCSANAEPTISNCIIAANRGYGVRAYTGSHLTIKNSTIAYNSWLGIYARDSNPTLSHCIIWGNWRQISTSGSAVVTASYSNIQWGWPGSGNIDVDPSFVGPPDGFDYHLSSNSPCIDMGDPSYVQEPNQTDIDGQPRIVGAAIDIGADEAYFEGPLIGLSATSFQFLSPGTQTLGIRNAGIDTLNWQIDYDCDWLTVVPDTGSSGIEATEVTLTADTTGLGTGPRTFACDLVVSAPDAENTPQSLRVELTLDPGTMIVSGLPARVNTWAGPVHLPFDIVSNGQLSYDGIYVWTYTGGTLDITGATNRTNHGELYDDDPLCHDLLSGYVDTTNVAHPVIWADISIVTLPYEIIGDIISDLGLTIAQGFEGTVEVKVMQSSMRSG